MTTTSTNCESGENRTYTTVFFDLDGTLLSMDTDEFMQAYFESIAVFMGEHGIPPQQGTQELIRGVKAMMVEHEGVTNADMFWNSFCAALDLDRETAEPQFMQYYTGPFTAIGQRIEPSAGMVGAVQALKEKGYALAITTMPMFPLLAIEERVRWAGLAPSDFLFLTDYETSTSVKPKPLYYTEALNRAGAEAADVLMVGNHNREDGFATKLGCDIYLVEDHLIEVEDGISLAEHKHGSADDFRRFCEALPPARA